MEDDAEAAQTHTPSDAGGGTPDTRIMIPSMASLRFGTCTSAVVAVLLAAACAAAASPSRGEVGGPPSIKLGPPDEGTQTSPALVIGVGSVLGYPVQIVSYGWEAEADSPPADFCVWIEHPRGENEFGTCDTSLRGSLEGAISLDMRIQTLGPVPGRATAIGGRISPDVAAVRLYFHRSGSKKRHQVKAIVAQVDQDLQRRLEQPVPFGFFYAKVHGLVGFGEFHVQALDVEGRVIGTVGRGF